MHTFEWHHASLRNVPKTLQDSAKTVPRCHQTPPDGFGSIWVPFCVRFWISLATQCRQHFPQYSTIALNIANSVDDSCFPQFYGRPHMEEWCLPVLKWLMVIEGSCLSPTLKWWLSRSRVLALFVSAALTKTRIFVERVWETRRLTGTTSIYSSWWTHLCHVWSL